MLYRHGITGKIHFDRDMLAREFIVLCGVTLNIVLSFAAQKMGLPLYLDSIGTILTAWECGMLASIATALISSILSMPFSRMSIYFMLVNMLIAISASRMFDKGVVRRKNWFLIFWGTITLIGSVAGGGVGWILNKEIAIAFQSVPMVDSVLSGIHSNKIIGFLLVNILINIADKLIATVAVWAAVRKHPIRFYHFSMVRGRSDQTENFDMNRQYRRVLISVAVEAIGLVAACAWISVSLYTQNARRERILVARGAAQQVVNAVDPRLIDVYLNRGTSAQSYEEVRNVLQGIRDNTPDLQYVYVYRIEEDGCHVVFDTSEPGDDTNQPGDVIPFDPSFLPHISTLLAGGHVEPIESNDSYGWLLTVYQPIYNAEGNCIAYAGVDVSMQNLRDYVRDFLLRVVLIASGFLIFSLAVGIRTSDSYQRVIRRQYEQIKEAKEEADYANTAKSHFLANMSHEIRTPINAVLGMNEMILRESEDDNVLEYAENVKMASNTLLSIINDILDFSKIEAGKMVITPADYDLSSVLNDLVNMIRTRADSKGLVLHLAFDEKTPKMLYGDEVRIKQVITNLLTNAVKYTEEGSVTFGVGYEKTEDPEEIVLIVSVTDTGIGIKKEDVEKLFSEFVRIEEKRNRNIEGTGLGMNITKSLLEMMGSALQVETEYGKGSTFSFRLKQKVVRWDELGDYEKAYREAIASREKYKEQFRAPDALVLVVDDTPMNLMVFKNLLKRTGIRIDTATGGDEALALTREKTYDLIFLDHMMPDKDGIETLQELRAEEENPNAHTVTICLTANAISGARENYIAAGFDDYLTKPIKAENLESMIMRYLPEEKMQTAESDQTSQNRAAETEKIGEMSRKTETTVILVVDDDPMIAKLAANLLGSEYRVEACLRGEEAEDRAMALQPDLILLDINLGSVTGFDVIKILRKNPVTSEIPTVILTGDSDENAEIRGFREGAADFIRKPFVPEVLRQRIRRIVELDHLQRNLQREVRHQTGRAERLTREIMLALSKAVDAKDHYTNGHSERVAAYSAEIARRMGKSPSEQEHIYEMGLLHDIGKIGISEGIINKNSRLTDEEFQTIKQHPAIGSDILRLITEMPGLADGARSHHEKYDGTGYPDRLKGEEIPEVARIICIADCYDAMTSTRTYSTPKPQEKVRSEIERCAGTQFDPEIAKVMLDMIDEDKDYVMKEKTADIRIWKGSDRLWQTVEEDQKRAERSLDDYMAETAEEPEDIPEAEIPEWLRGIAEIDVDTGLQYCGDEATYLETLKIYASNAASSAGEIENFWNSGDLANTTVKVHAIKSLSRTIGATEIGALAEKLEYAGKAGDRETMGAELGGLLERIRGVCRSLSPLCEPAEEEIEDESLPMISDEELQEAYEELNGCVETMDVQSAEYVFDFLVGYRLPQEERDRMKKIREAVSSFEWDEVTELLKRGGENG
ncbi:Response regulator c-di-GMP phosphodiesterase, RpfG family, contains REC and HD-GYP domains [[Clostridium] aminophilum]|uniref:Circadian input-output histidine kinase CikA n=1 Tax=[Clostridium] aminophilum TaxID=1526 RepID=A0A1H9ZYL2_9FIRM|nr:response regulator [[Clostridium] aminophilum]SES86852.1 Response regulator c-di-GMP phosphodiesterase, RpfG family, contains REC and HD-GYP domains [[Clostridium] aminophilum]